MADPRHACNLGAFSEAELAVIRQKSVCVVGCGGLGGFSAHALARFGIGRLTLIDGDVFSEANLNRQLFSSPENLGRAKVEICKSALEIIDPALQISTVKTMLDAENALDLLSNHDIVLDCLDNPNTRILLEKTAETLGIPFVHGAISGFCGQVAVVFPGDGLMARLYADGAVRNALKPSGNPVFTAQTVSALQCAEALKVLAGRGTHLAKSQVLFINLLDNDFEIVSV